jgi:hypothetical protein
MNSLHHHLKISHNRHSGRLRPHEYTSYIPLAFLLVVTGMALTISSVFALDRPGPASSSISLGGTMPGVAPKVAATISSPSDHQHFATSPVTVSGSCPNGTLVEVYKNDIFAGSTSCSGKGTYSLDVDLLFGTNTLVARVYDVLNQPGPDSQLVTVSYDVLPAQSGAITPLNFEGTQLMLNTDAVYRGIFPGQQLSIPVAVLGGVPPYAINVQWGDTSNQVLPRNNNVTFTVAHIYTKPGTYQVTLQATDVNARVAFLTVATIVNGQPAVASTGGSAPANTAANKLLVLWPLYTSAVAILVSFWLGERREKRLLGSFIPKTHSPA